MPDQSFEDQRIDRARLKEQLFLPITGGRGLPAPHLSERACVDVPGSPASSRTRERMRSGQELLTEGERSCSRRRGSDPG